MLFRSLKRKIPYSVWGGVRFFERKEIKDVICYLRLVASDADDMAFARIVNLPARKFGATSMARLRALAEQSGQPLMTTLRQAVDTPAFNRPQTRAFIELIDNVRRLAPSMPVSELTDRILNDSRLADHYRMDEREDRLENITELIGSMREFEL